MLVTIKCYKLMQLYELRLEKYVTCRLPGSCFMLDKAIEYWIPLS